jgi:hypothetical protein
LGRAMLIVSRGRLVRSSGLLGLVLLLLLLSSNKEGEDASIVARFSHCASRWAFAYLLPSSVPSMRIDGTDTASGAAGRFSGKCELVVTSVFDRERPPICSRSDSLRSFLGRTASDCTPFGSSESSDVRALGASFGVPALEDLLNNVRLRSFLGSLPAFVGFTSSPSKCGGSMTSSVSVVVRMMRNSGTTRSADLAGGTFLAMLSFFLSRSLRPFMVWGCAVGHDIRDRDRWSSCAGNVETRVNINVDVDVDARGSGQSSGKSAYLSV